MAKRGGMKDLSGEMSIKTAVFQCLDNPEAFCSIKKHWTGADMRTAQREKIRVERIVRLGGSTKEKECTEHRNRR